jgi:hypothetical protein
MGVGDQPSREQIFWLDVTCKRSDRGQHVLCGDKYSDRDEDADGRRVTTVHGQAVGERVSHGWISRKLGTRKLSRRQTRSVSVAGVSASSHAQGIRFASARHWSDGTGENRLPPMRPMIILNIFFLGMSS